MTDADPEAELIEAVARYTHDPLGYVRFAYPWGEPGTELAQERPRTWQADILDLIGRHLRDPATYHQPLLVAVASGHGIGKSALVSQIIDWGLSTHDDCKILVTAGTEPQLRTKTWPEVSKWRRLSITEPWFRCVATSLHSTDAKHEKTWRADAMPWSEHNSEAFAGLHNKGKRIIVIFDEASAIHDKIWEVTTGALTDEGTEIIWLAFGNYTKNAGRFHECFGKNAHRWHTRQIDSRTVEGTNKEQLAKDIQDYGGEDSDLARVRIKGQAPRAGSMQFIPSDIVAAACTREATAGIYDPLVLGVDVARSLAGDESCLRFRRGRDARSIKPIYLRTDDTMLLAGRVVQEARERRADAVFIDVTGVGGGVVDRCRQLGLQCIGVNNGGVSDIPVEGELVGNKAAEMYARMRIWLRTGGAIDDDPALRAQLEGREYGYNAHNEIILERKDDMKKRGLSSPDRADGLSLTFAYPVAQRVQPPQLHLISARNDAPGEWDPFRSET